MVLYLLLGAGLTLTNGWAAAASAVPLSTEPAIDALDIAASAVLLLMICWNAPKFTAGILGGSPAFTGGDAIGTAGAIAQGALLAGAAVAGSVALGSRALGAMSASRAAGMGNGDSPPPPPPPTPPTPPPPGGGGSGSSGGGGAQPPKGARAVKGLLMSGGFLRAAQASIPTDVAPPATPPALDIRSEGGE